MTGTASSNAGEGQLSLDIHDRAEARDSAASGVTRICQRDRLEWQKPAPGQTSVAPGHVDVNGHLERGR